MDKFLSNLADISGQIGSLNSSGSSTSPTLHSDDRSIFTDDLNQETGRSCQLESSPAAAGSSESGAGFTAYIGRGLDSQMFEQGGGRLYPGSQEWDGSSPGKRTAAIVEIDRCMLAEFTNLPEPFGSGSAGSSSVRRHWAPNLLLECAKAVVANETPRVQNLMWVLNELASPYGDCDQRLASSFLQVLFCKITGSGSRCHRILCAAAEKSYSFDSMRKMILMFQEASPWTTFGHVAANGAIMEAFEGEMKVHIVDINTTFCTQWPTLLEALATRADGAPHFRLTTIIISEEECAIKVVNQIMTRLERFAKLMGVPYEFHVIQQPQLEKLEVPLLKLRHDEALAINCIHTLHQVPDHSATGAQYSPRDVILCTFKNTNPKIVTIVEDEVDLLSPDFLTSFCEALRFYSILFESLEESFPRASNERLMLERAGARNMVNLLACDPLDSSERREKGSQWGLRLLRVGLKPTSFSDDTVDDVRSLLKRHKEGWGLAREESGLFLTWKDRLAIHASAWK